MGVLDKIKNLPVWGRALVVVSVVVVVLLVVLAATGQFSKSGLTTPSTSSPGGASGFSIVRALYYLPANGIATARDVTKQLEAKADLKNGIIPLTNLTLFPAAGGSWFGSPDPAPGKIKNISLTYTKNGSEKTIEFPETQTPTNRKDIVL